jgi:DNA-binding CsgD family transcriptional regulator
MPAAAPEDPLDARVARLADELGLTPRERDVFALLMRGRSVPYIRDELMVSRETVATHVKHIYQKAGVHSRQELLDLGA